MSGSGASEMAPTSSKVVVFPKFDMQVYTSELTSSKLKAAVADYLIPTDLHPRLPPPGMTMDRLSSRYIGLYVEQLEQRGLRIPFSSFFLAVIKHFGGQFFSFENKIDRGTRKCFKEVTTSLKDLHDDFSSNFNQDDVERLSKFLVLLQPPPRHLLYVCGLTTACRHPRLSYSIKDEDKNARVILFPDDQRPKPRVTPPMPKGSKILNLTAFQRSVEMPNTKIAAAREKKEKQSLARAEAKCAGAGHAGGSRKKQKVQKQNEPTHSESEETLSASPIRQTHLEADKKPATVIPPEVNHVATPAEDEFLGTLSNAEVLSRAYQTLGQSVVAQGKLLKSHEQLNHDYVDLRNRRDTDLAELERLRSGLRKANQEKDEITKKFTLLDNAYSKSTSREKELLDMVKELEREMDEWRATALGQVEKIRHLERDLELKTQQLMAAEEKLVKEFIPIVVKRLHTSVEYRKSLPAPVQLCFTAGWLGGLALGRTEEEKIADSCDLSLIELWSVHPDAPSPEGVTLGGAAESTIQQPPSTSPKTTSDIPFETTT
nr:hypothetical protein [Tanacetum cinerariifolium]